MSYKCNFCSVVRRKYKGQCPGCGIFYSTAGKPAKQEFGKRMIIREYLDFDVIDENDPTYYDDYGYDEESEVSDSIELDEKDSPRN